MTLLSTKLAFNMIVRIVLLTIVDAEVPPTTTTTATSKTPVHRRASTTSRRSIGHGVIFSMKFLSLFVADQLAVELRYSDQFSACSNGKDHRIKVTIEPSEYAAHQVFMIKLLARGRHITCQSYHFPNVLSDQQTALFGCGQCHLCVYHICTRL
jgi:hypothetical protein